MGSATQTTLRLILASLLLVMLLPASPARAQGWLGDRQRTEGPGFRVGNLELHPGFGAEVGYDNNVFLEENETDDAAIMRLTAHLMASTLSEQRRQEEGGGRTENRAVKFRGGLNVSYWHYFIDSLDDNASGDLGLDLTINPDGLFFVRLTEHFGRTIRPFSDEGARGTSYGRNTNLAGVDFGLQSRGGVLSGRAGYRIEYDFFDDNIFDYGNSLTHHANVGINWRFLPNTAILHQTKVSIQDYTDPADAPATRLSDNIRVESTVGLNGAFTNTWSLATLVGYTAGFYDAGDEYESVMARVESRYKPRDNIRWNLGYERRFRTSFIGNFYSSDKGYTQLQMMFGGAFLLGTEAAVEYVDTGTAVAPDGSPLGTQSSRSGVRLDLSLFGEYRFTDWLGVNAQLGYLADFTDFNFVDTGGMGALPDPGGGYSRFEAWLGVRVFY